MTQAHRMAAAVPRVEVAHHGDAPRVGRPYRKAHARHAVDFHRARAEAFEHRVRVAVGKPVQRFITEDRPKRIGVLDFLHRSVPVDAQPVRDGCTNAAHEQPVVMNLLQLAERRAVCARNNRDMRGIRQKSAYHCTRVALMQAQLRKGIRMPRFD